jgi:hypothetical protein
MKNTMWDEEARRSLVGRLARLTPDARGRWGRMSARDMLAHLTDAARLALGDLPAARKRVPLRYWPIRELVIYVLPMPRNVPTARELLGRSAVDWGEEMGALCHAIDRLSGRASNEFPEHPAFGRLSHRAWGVLLYRHTDHHLRQFGV